MHTTDHTMDSHYFIIILFPLYLLHIFLGATLDVSAASSSVSAVYAFGDSYADTGNNNNLVTAVKSDFRPYGVDFTNAAPTGRFSNGKVLTDFIGSHLGIKEFVPPYQNGSVSMHDEFITGVCFASSGSGYDPLTAQLFKVIPIQKQLDNFKEYKEKLESILGTEQADTHIQNSLFLIVCGTNDLAFTYLTVPTVRKLYTAEAYQAFILQNLKGFLHGLWNLGARRIGVSGVPPLGVLPVVVTIRDYNAKIYTALARDYNQKLQNELASLQQILVGGRFGYMDLYTPMLDMIERPYVYGFEQTVVACCGTGRVEVAILCDHLSPICSDRSKYVFWDSVHPTQKANFIWSKANWDVVNYLAAS